MGMAVGANDMANMMNKSQMVGHTQNIRATEHVKETDKARETEAARDADPESSTAENTTSVGSSSGASRTQLQDRGRHDLRGLQRLGRGQVEWQDEQQNQGSEWLPPSLRPQARGAGSSPLNIPYWLQSQPKQQADGDPSASHRRLLNGLRNMVSTEIQQYVKSNEPPYAKKTLREIYTVLDEDTNGVPPAQKRNVTGDPGGLTVGNWRRAWTTQQQIDNPQPDPGEAFEAVA